MVKSRTKPWWASRTLWLNACALTISLVQIFDGKPWFDPSIQAAILAVANAGLRMLTGQTITTGVRP